VPGACAAAHRPPVLMSFRSRLLQAAADHIALVRHVALLWRARVLRWRLETFGLYMPSLPSNRPWWRVNRLALRILLRQRQPYRRWLAEMRALQHGGPGGWWRRRLGRAYRPLCRWERSQNAPDSFPPDDQMT
jgi:hypothetical protein